MRTDEFRVWLRARRWNGKPLSSVSSRVSKARRFEKAMPALGLGDADLDAAFDADGLERATDYLRQGCRIATTTGEAPAALVGETSNAAMRIANVASAVRNYRQFREAEGSVASPWPALDDLRAAFLDRVPEFERFTRTDNAYERVERVYKDDLAAKVRAVAASSDDDEQAGRRVYRALIPNEGPLLRWQTDDDFARKFPALAPEFYGAIGRLTRDAAPIADAIMAAAARFAGLRDRGATTLTVGQVAAIAITVAGMIRPHQAAPFKMSRARELATLLTGDPIFRGAVLTRDQLDRWIELLRAIEARMHAWGWEPRDLLDVQGFAWAALDEDWGMINDEAGEPIVLFDADGNEYRPWLQGDPRAYEIKPEAATSNKSTEMVRVTDEVAMCRALLVDRLAVRIRKDGETWQNLLKYPGRTLIGYRLRDDIAIALGLPEEGESTAGHTARPAETDDAILAHFDINATFRQKRAAWNEDETAAFVDLARGINQLGLDWYFIDMPPYELRYGRKQRERQMADYVVASVDGAPPRMRLRERVPAAVKRIGGVDVGESNVAVTALGSWIEDHAAALANLADRSRSFGYWPDDFAAGAIMATDGAAAASAETDDEVTDANYWFVGASYGRTDDQVDRFLREGIWHVSTPTDRQSAQVMAMQAGDRIAIKATFVQRDKLPFDAYGRRVSVMRIKATGTILAASQDGETVRVAWDPDPTPRDWYFYTYQPTIWQVTPVKEMSRRLIRFAFGGEDQDIDWFKANLSRWQGEAEPEVEAAAPALASDPVNIVLYGPPGTGKTYCTIAEAVRLARGLAAGDPLLVDPARRDELRGLYEELRAVGQVRFVTFHQSYAYEDFVEGLRPETRGAGFELVPHKGVFCRIVDAALKSPEEHVLVIDEINRANISKVFGELITLIEPDKRLGKVEQATLTLPYSNTSFGVPANLHLVGTMNTADRSIALIDKALRRRFTFVEMMPDYSVAGMADEVDGAGVSLAAVLRTINERIEYLLDREHQIGHGWLIGCDTKTKLDAAMRDRVIPLIAEYFFEDWGRVADVLGGRGDNPFLTAAVLRPPPGMTDEEPRTSWSVRPAFAADAYRRLVGEG